MSGQGFFKRPFGQAPAGATALAQLQADWDGLAARISPLAGSRPDHARLQFFQLSADLDAFLRKWAPAAESQPQLQQRLQTARQSLCHLLQEAKALFEGNERQRLEQQRSLDRQRWQALQEQKRQAEHQARLKQTEQEIQAIYQSIRVNQQVAQERQQATWRAAHFPDTTCACGRAKMPNHLWCWDCAPGRRLGW
ncbi:MAG: hypothetical protein KF760_05910 [Candidatus Eremiobacteraeota bacterium]|nr:hypothetical protein [Candidatus Eremiobacteraeota bacterium]MCW5867071.1 hypothetical protein [Candidatus Eremiobacteraeota bacterium]